MSTDPRRARLQARIQTPQAAQPTPQPPPSSTVAPSPTVPTPTAPVHSQSIAPTGLDGSVDTPTPPTTAAPTAHAPATSQDEIPFKLKFCTVCASNNNRSMEAHLRLSTSTHQYPVISFGTGSYVRLPGPSISQPQVYNFNTTSYTKMYEELNAQDPRLYRNNGILNMLDRNRKIKWGPERFHDWIVGAARMEALNRGDKGAVGTEGGVVDVIFTCEERCWDAVVDNLLDRGAPLNRPVHVFNIDIKDNHEEALVGGGAILELADSLNEAAIQERQLSGTQGWENGTGAARMSFDEKVPEILARWQERWPNLPALWTLSWF
ncbi:RNA polymerase II subunit A domain phosphatase ssu72 [Cladophialophora bantiana CBS 173.52]|uniref:protein-serine/threonine phosphatase n=1 Tax=Cladophialophora bantiana (strain ATCC 10958 / CBS 173.52 / CDC B-1940 / NIH 8579) TaxID=1442370 RepID=A0A0D2EDS0_CLAB1|nr:RNA polymerase II subunit A domain phosphatase ssu72 [Cladophialophora bantiana CBS 173.52]KIW88281.1 RNA polymerase II subunit A domain phosphatase ssu72 [Cladophialophora bantiana CBS 173.52]